MKKLILRSIVVLCAIMFSAFTFGVEAQKSLKTPSKKAVLLLVHGSPSPNWCEKAFQIEKQVRQQVYDRDIQGIHQVRIALMEFSKPTIADVMKDFESEGVTDVLAIPLFIAPSDHSLEDIPAILGLSFDADKRKDLKKEGITLVNTSIKIQLAPTLNQGVVIRDIILDRVKALINDKPNQSLVLLAHGSERYQPLWEEMLQSVGEYIVKNSSIKTCQYAFIEMGQGFQSKALPVIKKASEASDHVIVQGVYLSSSIQSILRMSGNKEMLKKEGISFGKYGLLPDARISGWIVNRIQEWTIQK